MMKKKLISILITLLITIMSLTSTSAYAGTYKTITQTLTVTNTDPNNLPQTYNYNQNNQTGILNLQSVGTYTVSETTQVPVYKTVSQTFTDEVTKTELPTNDNSQFDATYPINQGGYTGTIPLQNVLWTTNYGINTKQVSVSTTQTANSSFPDTYNYSDSEGYKGTLTRNGSAYVCSGTAGDTKYVTNSSSNSTGYFPQSIPYNDGIYSGTLYASGSPTKTVVQPSSSKNVTIFAETITKTDWYRYTGPSSGWQCYDTTPHTYSKTYYYNDGTYSGTLTEVYAGQLSMWYTPFPSSPSIGETWGYRHYTNTYNYTGTVYSPEKDSYTQYYGGYVTKPDTRVWQQNYSGTASKRVIDSYDGTALYSGTLTKQVIDHYDTVPIKWTVDVTYSGYVNAKPIASFTTDKDSIIEGNSINITNTSTDSDGNIVSSVWSINPTNNITKNLTSNGGSITFNSPGIYTITLTVTDNDGATDTVSKQINVHSDTIAPQVDFSISPGYNVNDNDTLTYIPSITDPDGCGIDEYIWTLKCPDGTTKTYTNTQPPSQFIAAGLPGGTYALSYQVLGKSIDYGNGVIAQGKWSNIATHIITVKESMQIIGMQMSNIVKPPTGTQVPIAYPVATPTKINAGYKITLGITQKGGDTLTLKFMSNGEPFTVCTDNGNTDTITLPTPQTNNTQYVTFWLDPNTPINTIISLDIELSRTVNGTVRSIGNSILGNNFAQVVGTSLPPVDISLNSKDNSYYAGEAIKISVNTTGPVYAVTAQMWYPNNEYSSTNITNLVQGSNNEWHTRQSSSEGYDTVVIIPKNTPDGTYNIIITAYAKYPDGPTNTKSITIPITVKGTIYDYYHSGINN